VKGSRLAGHGREPCDAGLQLQGAGMQDVVGGSREECVQGMLRDTRGGFACGWERPQHASTVTCGLGPQTWSKRPSPGGLSDFGVRVRFDFAGGQSDPAEQGENLHDDARGRFACGHSLDSTSLPAMATDWKRQMQHSRHHDYCVTAV
jgi:hypothetical protein